MSMSLPKLQYMQNTIEVVSAASSASAVSRGHGEAQDTVYSVRNSISR